MSARPTPARSVSAWAGAARASRARRIAAANRTARSYGSGRAPRAGSMTLIVDGMNVIGTRPDGWWRDRRGAQRALVARLAALGEPLTVVFDGAAHDVDAPAGVEVAFAPVADDEIAARAAPGVTVVTSDRGLAERVRAAGGEVEPAKAFRDRLG